jgi:hypothetical protein
VQLIHLSSWMQLPAALLAGLIWLTAAVTVVSGMQYVVIWTGKAMRESHRAPHSGEQ